MGFTIIELLVVVVILATLLALMLPAIQSARNAASRMQCQANLRSIGQALVAYEGAKNRFPAGRDEGGEQRLNHSWSTKILPFVEEQALFDQYDSTLPWNDQKGRPEYTESLPDGPTSDGSAAAVATPPDAGAPPKPPTNYELAQRNLPVFQCPATAHEEDGAIDFGGNYGTGLTGLEAGFAKGQAWESGVLLAINLRRMKPEDVRTRGVQMTEITDGASHTFMVLENSGRPAKQGGQWANGHNCFSHDRPYINVQPSNEIFSKHHGLAHALMADGSLMLLHEDIDWKLLGALGTRRGGESAELNN